MPLPFEFEGKGVVVLDNQQHAEFVVPYANQVVHFQDLVNKKRRYIGEPTSVLDNITASPSPPASTSTLSSSHGGADTAGVAALSSKWLSPENQETSTSNVGVLDLHHFQPPQPPPVEIAAGNDKCGGIDDWENGDSGQDQAMLRWIMGDVEDPSIGLNKMLHATTGGAPADFEFNGGFGVVDQGFISFDSGQIGNLPTNPQIPPAPAMFNHHHHHQNQIFSP